MPKDILDVLEKKIQKDYGENIVIQGNHLKSGKLIRTGSIGLDLIIGGGVMEGTTLTLAGPYGVGKSSLALYMATEAQKMSRKVIYFDSEFALKPALLKTIPGLNLKELSVIRSSYAEETLDIMENYVKSGEKLFIILDSVASLLMKKESESEHEQETMMGVAKLMSKALRKMTGPCAKTCSNILFLNQYRTKPTLYGNPIVKPGGNALPYFATYEMEMKTGGKQDQILDKEGNIIGHNINIKITKNKLYTPFKTTTVPLLYGKGFDSISELINIGREVALIIQKGPYFYLYEKTYQGKLQLYDELTNKADIVNKLRGDIYKMFNFEETNE